MPGSVAAEPLVQWKYDVTSTTGLVLVTIGVFPRPEARRKTPTVLKPAAVPMYVVEDIAAQICLSPGAP
ncbi:hypothetical protein ACFY5C_27490 [Streptomyces sp. NPDC012935]|uniref:hypothetical protein n=1 Tax=Streptomyces sp. NPDC012935 TaxID=3364857 RepID=UPI00367F4C94